MILVSENNFRGQAKLHGYSHFTAMESEAQLAQGHVVSRWKSQDKVPALLTIEPNKQWTRVSWTIQHQSSPKLNLPLFSPSFFLMGKWPFTIFVFDERHLQNNLWELVPVKSATWKKKTCFTLLEKKLVIWLISSQSNSLWSISIRPHLYTIHWKARPSFLYTGSSHLVRLPYVCYLAITTSSGHIKSEISSWEARADWSEAEMALTLSNGQWPHKVPGGTRNHCLDLPDHCTSSILVSPKEKQPSVEPRRRNTPSRKIRHQAFGKNCNSKNN